MPSLGYTAKLGCCTSYGMGKWGYSKPVSGAIYPWVGGYS